MRRAGHVAGAVYVRNAYKIVLGNPKGKVPLWEQNWREISTEFVRLGVKSSEGFS
jgi:hypothetical protein